MSEFEGHTPGPWRAEGPDMFGDFNILHPTDSLAVGAVVSNLRPLGEVAANARLIAAAPDLLSRAERAEAKLVARAKDMVEARAAFINIRDELEDEGDRVYFGSTNDADRFKSAVEMLDEWAWSDIINDADKRDYIGECREQRERAERAEKERDALAAALKQILRIDWERGIDWDTNTLMRSYLDAANAMQALARAALAQTGGDDE